MTQIQIQEILRAHPEIKIRESLELYEDKVGNLFASTANGFLQIVAKDGDIRIQSTTQQKGLHPVRNLAGMRGD